MSSGGFWPGESPAAEQENVEEPEATIAEPPRWPQQPIEEPKAEPPAPERSGPEPDRPEPEPEPAAVAEPAVTEPEPEPEEEEAAAEESPALDYVQHVPGELDIPDGVAVLEGSPSGVDRTVGVVVSRFNGEISNQLLESALDALARAGVAEERITVMPVPGAFELPIGAMALAKTRRYSCVVPSAAWFAARRRTSSTSGVRRGRASSSPG